MSKYDVYAMGNALVDLEYQVDYSVLNTLNIDKGIMTLVDEARYQSLLQQLQLTPHLRACGGSAANTLQAINQFGGRGFYSCKVAADPAGDFYIHDLHRSGVDTNHLTHSRDDGKTGHCIVLLTPDADRTMSTYLGASADYNATEIDKTALINSHFLYIEGYLVSKPQARQAAIDAKQIAEQQRVQTVLTLSDPNMVQHFNHGMHEMIGSGVDFLFANKKEAFLFTQCDDIIDAAQALKNFAKRFIITLGPKGSLLFDGKQFIEIKPYDVEVVDTLGAGDMFAGAYLYALTQNLSHQQAADFASVASACMVAEHGPRLSQKKSAHVRKRGFEYLQKAVISA